MEYLLHGCFVFNKWENTMTASCTNDISSGNNHIWSTATFLHSITKENIGIGINKIIDTIPMHENKHRTTEVNEFPGSWPNGNFIGCITYRCTFHYGETSFPCTFSKCAYRCPLSFQRTLRYAASTTLLRPQGRPPCGRIGDTPPSPKTFGFSTDEANGNTIIA